MFSPLVLIQTSENPPHNSVIVLRKWSKEGATGFRHHVFVTSRCDDNGCGISDDRPIELPLASQHEPGATWLPISQLSRVMRGHIKGGIRLPQLLRSALWEGGRKCICHGGWVGVGLLPSRENIWNFAIPNIFSVLQLEFLFLLSPPC